MASANASRLALRAAVPVSTRASLLASHGSRTVHTIHPGLLPYLCPSLTSQFGANAPFARRSLHVSAPRRSPTPSSSSSKEVAATASQSNDSKAVTSSSSSTKKGTRLQRIWAGIKKEAQHYWHGTKLLGKEIRISARIQGRLLAGKKLTRRERRQVRKTSLPTGSLVSPTMSRLLED